jgi:hypothetical protein
MIPLFSIITPVYDTPSGILRQTIESVLAQSFSEWEWIVVDDCSPRPEVREQLRAAAEQDARIVVIERSENGHIVRASNDGVAAARGEFVVLLDHDDLLTPDALAEVAAAIARVPEADVLYSDEDRLFGNGSIKFRFEKPDWSPWRLRAQNYIGHLCVIRTELLRQVGGFREGFDGSQDHDLVFRATERAREVVHIPKVLYHWRVIRGSVADRLDAKPYATDAAVRAIKDHLGRVGLDANVSTVRPGLYEPSARLGLPRVSLIVVVPEASARHLSAARASIRRALADGRRWITEIVVVRPEDEEIHLTIDKVVIPKWRVREEVWRASETAMDAIVRASESANGSHVVILSAAVSPINRTWLRALLTPLEDAGVGLTSGLVRSELQGVVSAGLVERGGVWSRALRGIGPEYEGPFGALRMAREVEAVDGLCVAFRGADVAHLLPAALQSGATDPGVALSAVVRAAGMSIVWTGHCRLVVAEFAEHEVPEVPLAGAELARFALVEEMHDGWVTTFDRYLRLNVPSLLRPWHAVLSMCRSIARAFRRSESRDDVKSVEDVKGVEEAASGSKRV